MLSVRQLIVCVCGSRGTHLIASPNLLHVRSQPATLCSLLSHSSLVEYNVMSMCVKLSVLNVIIVFCEGVYVCKLEVNELIRVFVNGPSPKNFWPKPAVVKLAPRQIFGLQNCKSGH